MNSRSLWILSSLLCFAQTAWTIDATGKEVIEKFYRSYLNADNPKNKPSLEFSKSFRKLLAKSARVCRQKAGTDICGWGSESDPYIDAQDYDPKSFEKSGAVVLETAPGQVQIRFNTNPREKENPSQERVIRFRMIRENGRWVVDDILYQSGSARKALQIEIDNYLKH